MNRPKRQTPNRPRMASARVARSAKTAAINLVRLEFDAARLRQGLEQARSRTDALARELHRNSQERRLLMTMLSRENQTLQMDELR